MGEMSVAIPISAELLLLFPTMMLSKEMRVSSLRWDLLFSSQMNHHGRTWGSSKTVELFHGALDLL